MEPAYYNTINAVSYFPISSCTKVTLIHCIDVEIIVL